MSRTKAPRIVPPDGYTADEARLARAFEPILQQLHAFGGEVGDAMRAHPELADVHQLGEDVHRLFQKWNLEILYLLALREGLRFNELHRALPGISTRTLSEKLSTLEASGYVQRTVSEAKPLRVDYTATPLGRTLARLTVPLVMFLRFRQDGALQTAPDRAAPQ